MASHKIEFEGATLNVREVEYEPLNEAWQAYKLPSGHIVRLLPQVTSVVHICDDAGKPRFDSDGMPNILVKHKIDIVLAPPES